MKRALLLALFLLLPLSLSARPIVVELYTSLGCSSCPPADAFLGEMVGKPDLLPLSFHVQYWDHLGWKDPFGIAQSRRRQKTYADRFDLGSLFTPQMVVDGLATAIGSHRKAVGKILLEANKNLIDIPIEFRFKKEQGIAEIKVFGLDDGVNVLDLPEHLDVWYVTFNKGYRTPVEGGENVGKDIQNFNIVRKLVLLGKWNQRTDFYRIKLEDFTEDAFAVLVQEEDAGRILGAAVHYQR